MDSPALNQQTITSGTKLATKETSHQAARANHDGAPARPGTRNHGHQPKAARPPAPRPAPRPAARTVARNRHHKDNANPRGTQRR
jgi:hypothetical protein